MIPLRRLCPGVEPDPYEFLVYLVKSHTRSSIVHRVDFAAWDGFGDCGCEHFSIKVRPALQNGVIPDQSMECNHITRARRALALEVAQGTIERRQAQANKNRKRPQPYHYNAENPAL